MGAFIWHQWARYVSLTAGIYGIWAGFWGILFRKFFWDFIGGKLQAPAPGHTAPSAAPFVTIIVTIPLLQIITIIMSLILVLLEEFGLPCCMAATLGLCFCFVLSGNKCCYLWLDSRHRLHSRTNQRRDYAGSERESGERRTYQGLMLSMLFLEYPSPPGAVSTDKTNIFSLPQSRLATGPTSLRVLKGDNSVMESQVNTKINPKQLR
ncbi:hypothetical protein AG1IA_07056 [Rhizoctonia solani AG-1 IA]|uniref:DUF7727 domain-containing protein n=1 Tax=Thanatephorus cucumeris (strain AG1-IA) TaxID=983506 RepID=L8WLT3_THACA|nr:hypothetical protein AG1IA_07056 [Rhizoctonia solani AG-1 IA]